MTTCHILLQASSIVIVRRVFLVFDNYICYNIYYLRSNLKGLFQLQGPLLQTWVPNLSRGFGAWHSPPWYNLQIKQAPGKILDDMFLLTFLFCSHFYCKNPDFVNLKIVKKLRSGVPFSLPVLDELHVTFTPVAHFPNNKGGLFEY